MAALSSRRKLRSMKKQFLLTILIIIPVITLLAQPKLKSVQVASVWAPANVKIDGDLEEWDNNFQAENKAGGLFYTLSNNNLYLYLAVTGIDTKNSAKLAAGGITFTINTDG